MSKNRWLLLGGILAVAVLLVVLVARRPSSAVEQVERTWSPLPRRVVVEVINSGGVEGAGRSGMMLLRRAGLDVVYLGNARANEAGRIRNQVLVRRGDTVGVGRVMEALGGAEMVSAPDSTRLVDLTVLLGKRYAVPKGY